MALPRASVPEFLTKIPSTGQQIKFRPFLVKEEKILLIAMEGGDKKEIINATKNVLSSCIISEDSEKIDVSKLTTFDVEFLFLRIRGKSVNETLSFTLKHHNKENLKECNHATKIDLNIDDIEVVGDVHDGVIVLDEETGVGVKMRYPDIDSSDILLNFESESEAVFDLIAYCVDSVFDADEVYSDFTNEEMKEWIGSLKISQFKMLSDFIENTPKLKHDLKWKCGSCGKTETVVLEGLENFFT